MSFLPICSYRKCWMKVWWPMLLETWCVPSFMDSTATGLLERRMVSRFTNTDHMINLHINGHYTWTHYTAILFNPFFSFYNFLYFFLFTVDLDLMKKSLSLAFSMITVFTQNTSRLISVSCIKNYTAYSKISKIKGKLNSEWRLCISDGFLHYKAFPREHQVKQWWKIKNKIVRLLYF